jgi:carboxyl-terminal processing protease
MLEMKDFFSKRYQLVIIALLLIGVIFFSGFYFGRFTQSDESKIASVINKENANGTKVDFAPFWKAWEIINEKYVATNSTTTERVSDQARVWGAIEGMTASLGDPYTTFFPPVEARSFAEEISGNFEGVGMEVGIRDGVLTVVSPLKGTPAYNAGIKSGDKVIQIDKTLTAALSQEEAINLIRGKKGTTVKLTIVREGIKDPFEINVVRDVIDIPTIDTETKGDVFVIHLYNFSAISSNSFRDALRKFVESGKYKLILDLRGNPGGYLESAIDMASWFLPAGKTVVKEDFRNAQDAQVYRSKGYNIFNSNLKMVVLIDGGSASASEILAGALHENGVATLVGTQSFGKGSVQELVPVTSDTSLKVTIAKWLTPNGISISHGGLTPDVVVKLDEKEFLKGNDTQLNKALEILSK